MRNCIHGSIDHLWGDRFYPQVIKDMRQYFRTFEYINQNPVKAGLCKEPRDWKESGSYYIANNVHGLVDFLPIERLPYIKLLL